MGVALQVMRDEKLYLSTHATFEGYCSDVWNLSRPRAYQLINHASTVKVLTECEALSTIVDTITESATRELSGLNNEQKINIVRIASDGGRASPTAAKVRLARKQTLKVAPKDAATSFPESVGESETELDTPQGVEPSKGESADPSVPGQCVAVYDDEYNEWVPVPGNVKKPSGVTRCLNAREAAHSIAKSYVSDEVLGTDEMIIPSVPTRKVVVFRSDYMNLLKAIDVVCSYSGQVSNALPDDQKEKFNTWVEACRKNVKRFERNAVPYNDEKYGPGVPEDCKPPANFDENLPSPR